MVDLSVFQCELSSVFSMWERALQLPLPLESLPAASALRRCTASFTMEDTADGSDLVEKEYMWYGSMVYSVLGLALCKAGVEFESNLRSQFQRPKEGERVQLFSCLHFDPATNEASWWMEESQLQRMRQDAWRAAVIRTDSWLRLSKFTALAEAIVGDTFC